ncbi:ABC transporter permease [Roseococcus suduntuyensis]|uniref:Peptide/nickel transport system permease protein n=1 Tax=Roseococcus suduntuyensis TaxID=455361 RepID=A0A840AAE6_9PROT|nr:ABC transporter permease [Roseococcus suduntuyensis]MBB3897254.1 peptide/nickel transport system permease protein [Roseococcus suduntuyensis]
MTGLILSRLAQIAVMTVILSLCAFLLIGLMPGDPIEMAIAGDPRLTSEDAARLRELHGLDQPLMSRYFAWAGEVLRGNFGHSRLFAQPVAQLLWPALLSSLELLALAIGIAITLGVGLGALAAARPRLAPFVQGVALVAQATPSFWLGILLIILFAVQLGWLPAGGADAGWRFLVLPVATLAFANLAAYARHSAAALRAALEEPHIRTARAKGASEARVLARHALPNAAVPLLTIAALDAGAMVSGALITETVFARPGMGKLIYDAVMGNDFNLALLALLLVAVVTMLATLAADLAQRWLDPRIA